MRFSMIVRNFLGAVALATTVAVASAPAAVVTINPFGDGNNPAHTLNASSLAFAPGNVVAIGAAPIPTLPNGSTVPVLYQSFVSGINTVGGNDAAILNVNTGRLGVDNGTIQDSGNQFTITAQFSETITDTTSAGGQTVVTLAPAFGVGPNIVQIYAQSATSALAASLNRSNTGYATQPPGAVLILTGHLVANNFTSSFSVNNSTFGSPDPLDNHTGGNYPNPGQLTVVGTGNTGGLSVAVDTFNPNYFLTAPGTFQLNFNTISSATPFAGTDPASIFFNGHVPNLGPVNGNGGGAPGTQDFQFQSQAVANFAAVPEPGTITMALAGLGLFSLATLRARRRSTVA